MRSICKKGSAILVAVLALCALAAGSASASQWYVGGKAMTGSEKLSETAKVEESIVFTIGYSGDNKAKVTCTALKSAKSEIDGSSVISLKEPVFEGCKLVVPAEKECTLENPSIEMAAINAKMALGTSPEDTSELAPKTGNEWGNIVANELGCNEFIGGPIKGTLTLKAPKAQTEATEQEFAGEGELSKGLTLWSNEPTYITGKFKLKLASGKAWSFH